MMEKKKSRLTMQYRINIIDVSKNRLFSTGLQFDRYFFRPEFGRDSIRIGTIRPDWPTVEPSVRSVSPTLQVLYVSTHNERQQTVSGGESWAVVCV